MAVEPTKTIQKAAEKPSAAVDKQKNPLRIKDTTSDYLWTVVGLESCEWTKKTVEALKEHDERFKYIELNAEWQRRLVVEYGTRRVPAIFKGSSFFGSHDVLENYYKCSFISDAERF